MSHKPEPGTCRIVIPVYRPLTEPEADIVRHNLGVLGGYPATLVGPESGRALLESVRQQVKPVGGKAASIETFDDRYFRNIPGYNELLMTSAFYRRFRPHEFILICQHDAMVFEDRLREWIGRGYSYVGAPQFEGYARPAQPLRFRASLNGGLSLRRVPDAIAALEKVKWVRRNRIMSPVSRMGLVFLLNLFLSLAGRKVIVYRLARNEDRFWTEIVPAEDRRFRIPTPEIAAEFAFEVCPGYLYELIGRKLPFGCHAFERYDPEFWKAHYPVMASRIDALAKDDAAG